MQLTPLISVVVPTYNGANVLRRALVSILRQTYQKFEVFVVDDGSTEDIESVVRTLNDPRICYLRLLAHTNANVARNAGIRAAKGQYVAMLDSDDEWLPQHLQRRLEKITEWACDGIHGSFLLDDGVSPRPVLSRPRRPGESAADYALSGDFAVTPSHFYDRVAALATLWDETLTRHQDYDFSIRFGTRFIFRCDPEPTVVVHWVARQGKKYDYQGCIQFYEKHKNNISPAAAVEYLLRMMIFAVSSKAAPEITSYYTGELRRLREHINSPFELFLSQHPIIYFYWSTHPKLREHINSLRVIFHRLRQRWTPTLSD